MDRFIDRKIAIQEDREKKDSLHLHRLIDKTEDRKTEGKQKDRKKIDRQKEDRKIERKQIDRKKIDSQKDRKKIER